MRNFVFDCSSKDIFKSAKKLAKAIVKFYGLYRLKPVALVGYGVNRFAQTVAMHLNSVLLSFGIDVDDVGCVSSGQIAHLSKQYNYPLSIFVGGDDCGERCSAFVCVFNSLGEKIGSSTQNVLNSLMNQSVKAKLKFGAYNNVEKLKQNYYLELKNYIRFSFPCIFDCACGTTCETVKKLFPHFEKINVNKNVNDSAVSNDIMFLRSLCLKKYKIGFWFDCCGDKLKVVSENGTILESEQITYILSKFYQANGDVLIIPKLDEKQRTKIENKKINIINADENLNLYEFMKKNNSTLATNSAGEIIFSTYSHVSDAVLTAILLGNIIQLSTLSLEELLK